MASNLIFQSPKGKVALFGGLEWRILNAVGDPMAHLRELARDRSASFAALSTSSVTETVTVKGRVQEIHRVSAGYFTSVDNTKPPAGAHSLAAAFARWAVDHPNALLNVKLQDGRHAVVVIQDGNPVIDKVEDSDLAALAIGRPYQADHPEMSVFSDDLERYPSAVVYEDLLESICEWTSKETAIKAIPVDLVKVGAVALVLAAMVAGWVGYSKWDAEQKRQAALAKQRAEDPIPKYLNALALASQDVGIDRESIAAGIGFAQKIPVLPDGWNTSRIGCVQHAGCEVIVRRTTGTFDSLVKSAPLLTLNPAAAVNLNEARMSWPQTLGKARLTSVGQVPDLSAFIQGPEASKLQDWLVAGLTIQLSPQQLWPQAEGVPPSFRHPKALAMGKFEIDGIALPQMLEVVERAPENVHWTSWAVELGDPKQEPLSRAKGRLTGNYYVKKN